MDDERADLIARLFYLLTVALEDGAALAVEGQDKNIDPGRREEIAGRLWATGQLAAILSQTISTLAASAG